MNKPRVLVLDHKDSFVFILAEQFLKLGAELQIYRSDLALSTFQELVERVDPTLVVLSPGPGRPESAGVTVPWLSTRPRLPILGICLGHQAMAQAAGGVVARAPRPVHGKPWPVELLADPLFEGLPATMPVARYHSLVVTEVPEEFRVIARAHDSGVELVMAMRHRSLPQVGLQFHPESFLSPLGGRLVEAVLAEAVAHSNHRSAPVKPEKPGESGGDP